MKIHLNFPLSTTCNEVVPHGSQNICLLNSWDSHSFKLCYPEEKCERVLGTTWSFPTSLRVFIKIGIYAYLLSENSKGGSCLWYLEKKKRERDVAAFLQHEWVKEACMKFFRGQLATSAESQCKWSRKDFAQEGCLLVQEHSNRRNLEG